MRESGDTMKLKDKVDELEISLYYWAPFTITALQWDRIVAAYSWDSEPEFLGDTMYQSKGGLKLLSPLYLIKQLDASNIHGHTMGQDSGKQILKPPRDQIAIIGHQTGYELLNMYLLLRGSFHEIKDAEGELTGEKRKARIDVVSPNKSTLERFISRELKKPGIVSVYESLDALQQSPAFGSYDGLVTLEPISQETRHELLR